MTKMLARLMPAVRRPGRYHSLWVKMPAAPVAFNATQTPTGSKAAALGVTVRPCVEVAPDPVAGPIRVLREADAFGACFSADGQLVPDLLGCIVEPDAVPPGSFVRVRLDITRGAVGCGAMITKRAPDGGLAE